MLCEYKPTVIESHQFLDYCQEPYFNQKILEVCWKKFRKKPRHRYILIMEYMKTFKRPFQLSEQ